jgi:hypothetical protein
MHALTPSYLVYEDDPKPFASRKRTYERRVRVGLKLLLSRDDSDVSITVPASVLRESREVFAAMVDLAASVAAEREVRA